MPVTFSTSAPRIAWQMSESLYRVGCVMALATFDCSVEGRKLKIAGRAFDSSCVAWAKSEIPQFLTLLLQLFGTTPLLAIVYRMQEGKKKC
jgi:hypothetical protein